MKLKELAEKLKTQTKGDGEITVKGIRDIETLVEQGPAEGYVYFLESRKFLKKYPDVVKAQLVLTSEQFAGEIRNGLVTTEKDLRETFIRLLTIFEYRYEPKKFPATSYFADESAEIHPEAVIMPGAVVMEGAKIGRGTRIYPNSVIEPYASIGEYTIVYSCSVIGHHCVVGSHCIIYQNTAIGADGFGYHRSDPPQKVPQIGNVVIGDHVEVGANSSIDRATLESTIIGDYTKLDDQVHIGHNCRLGRSVFVAGNAGISGSVIIEDFAIIAGQAGLADHIRIGKGAVVMALTGVPSDLAPGKAYFGIPAREAREMHKINSSLGYLPALLKRVSALEEKAGISRDAENSGD